MLETSEQGPLETSQAGFFARVRRYWLGAYRGIRIAPYEVVSPKLTGAAPIRIALVSDIHADTRFMPLPRVRQVVSKTNALQPDLVLLGGDLSAQSNFSMTPLPLEETVLALSDLRARLGVFAVMGNHDWWDDTDTQTTGAGPPNAARLLRDAGLHVLSNAAVRLEHASEVWLAGLDSQMAFERKAGAHLGADDLAAALNDVRQDAFTVMLAHEPDIFAELKPHDPVDLVVSGHTHGGQIRIFGATPVVPSKYGSRYAHGQFQENRRNLIVSAGLGCSKYPLRFGVMPEIVLITLRGAE